MAARAAVLRAAAVAASCMVMVGIASMYIAVQGAEAAAARVEGALGLMHERVGFVLYDLDDRRHIPHALLAARSLWTAGGLRDPQIVIVTTCAAPDPLSLPSHDEEALWYETQWQAHRRSVVFKHVLNGTKSTQRLRQSHMMRVSEAFRFLPRQVRIAVVLDAGVYAGAPLSEMMTWLQRAVQVAAARSEEGSTTNSFLMARPAEGGDGWSTGITVINRKLSTSCLLACQLSRDMQGSSENTPQHQSSLNAHIVHFPQPACSPVSLAPEMYSELSRFHLLLKHRSPFVRIFTNSRTTNEKEKGGLYVSRAEHDRYVGSTLGLGADFVAASYRTREGCRGDGVQWEDDDAATAATTSNKLEQHETRQQEQVSGPAPPQVPHIALGGFAKCATTTLYEWLIKHPNIMEPWTKEPNFDFASYETAVGRAYLDQLLYGQRHGTEPTTGPNGTPMLSIDASTHLLWNVTHVANLKKRSPGAKLIAVACDPTARLISHWNYRRFVWEWEFLEGKRFDDVVERQLREMPDWVRDGDYAVDPGIKVAFELDGDDSEGVWQMVREGLYELALQRVETVFDPANILVVLKDDIREHPLQVLQQVERFLGIPSYGKWEEVLQRITRHNVNRHSKELLSPEMKKEVDAFYHIHNRALARRLGRRHLPWA